MLNKKKINTFLIYCLTLFIILDTRSVFSHIDSGSYGTFFSLAIFILSIGLLSLNLGKSLSKKYFCFLLLYIMYILIFILIKVKENMMGFIYLFLFEFPLFFLLFHFLNLKCKKQFMKSYTNLLLFISLISLFFYIFGSVLHILNVNTNLVINWGKVSDIQGYYFLHFNAQKTVIFNRNILRNTSIFVEGPMYALHLLIGTCFSLFFDKKIFNIYTITFGIAIMTSLSITGILLFLFLIMYKYSIYVNKNVFKYVFFILLIIIGVVLGYVFFKDKLTSRSYSIRIDDYIAAIKAWKLNKIFGNGYQNNERTIMYMSNYRLYNVGLSNSFVIVLSQCGLYLTSLYIVPLVYGFIKSIKSNNSFFIVLFILQIFLFFTSAFQYTTLMMFLLALDYYFIFNSKNERKYTK